MLQRKVHVWLRAAKGSPYSQSKRFTTQPGGQYPGPDSVDANCWREHLHVDKDGNVVIPGMALKSAIISICSLRRDRIAGKGRSEYRKHFLGGCRPLSNPEIKVDGKPLSPNDVECELIDCQAQPGIEGPRVGRRYPMIYGWTAEVEFAVLSDDIEEALFEDYLADAGVLVGIGRWRAERGGMNGCFEVAKCVWDKRLPSKTSESAKAVARGGKKSKAA